MNEIFDKPRISKNNAGEGVVMDKTTFDGAYFVLPLKAKSDLLCEGINEFKENPSNIDLFSKIEYMTKMLNCSIKELRNRRDTSILHLFELKDLLTIYKANMKYYNELYEEYMKCFFKSDFKHFKELSKEVEGHLPKDMVVEDNQRIKLLLLALEVDYNAIQKLL